VKIWIGSTILIAGHHFIPYAKKVAEQVEGDIAAINIELSGQEKGQFTEVGEGSVPVGAEF
jgi:hypothetical protein